MSVTTDINLKDKLLSDFNLFEAKMNGEASSNWHQNRKSALAKVRLQDFPTRKDEEWKYTSLKEITNQSFGLLTSSLLDQKLDLSNFMIEGLDPIVLTFINGQWSKINSAGYGKIGSAIVGSLKKGYEKHADLLEPILTSEQTGLPFLGDLNTAFATDGAFVHVPDNTQLDIPVLIINLTDASEGNQMASPKNVFVVGKNSSAKIIEIFDCYENTNASFTNSNTSVFADRDARLDYYKIQQENTQNNYQVNNTHVTQNQNSNVSVGTFTFGGKLVRNNLTFLHKGEHINSFLNGIYLTRNHQLVDNHTLVDHATPNCMSDEFYKGIMGGNSKAVFNGKIMVRQDAQKTNAFQTNRNVLVSEKANVYTKPQLEIFADDVKCSHGCTIGQLDDAAMFYMQARGIGKEKARKLLLQSFVGEVIERIQMDEMKNHIGKLNEKFIEKL